MNDNGRFSVSIPVLRRKWLPKYLSVFLAATMVASLALPFLQVQESPGTAEAADLDWSDARPPLTDIRDTFSEDGFTALPTFGNTPHRLAVASNGHLFAGGKEPGSPDARVFRSEDGGRSWTASAPFCSGGAVWGLRVSPRYAAPSNPDNTVLALCTNALAISRNRGLGFTSTPLLSAGALPTSFAVAPDFDGNTRGTVLVGSSGNAGAHTERFDWNAATGSFTVAAMPEGAGGVATDSTLALAFQPRVGTSTPLNVSSNAGSSEFPAIAVGGDGTIHVAWHDNTGLADPLKQDIFYATRAPGASFSTPINVTNNLGDSERPSIFVDGGGTVHLVWQDNTGLTAPNIDIFYASKAPGATAFSAPLNVSSSAGNSQDAKVGVDGTGTVHVVWADSTERPQPAIFYARKAPFDTAFLGFGTVNAPTPDEFAGFPSLAVEAGGTVHVAWSLASTTGPAVDIFYSKKAPADIAFLQPSLNASNNAGKSDFPDLAVDGAGTVHLVWHDDTGLTAFVPDIVYASKTSAATAFSAAQNVSNNSGVSRLPQVGLDGSGRIHVVWADDTGQAPGKNEVLHATRAGAGEPFSPAQNLSRSPGDSTIPALAVAAGGRAWAVWMDNTPGNFETFFATTFDGILRIYWKTGTGIEEQRGFLSAPWPARGGPGTTPAVGTGATPLLSERALIRFPEGATNIDNYWLGLDTRPDVTPADVYRRIPTGGAGGGPFFVKTNVAGNALARVTGLAASGDFSTGTLFAAVTDVAAIGAGGAVGPAQSLTPRVFKSTSGGATGSWGTPVEIHGGRGEILPGTTSLALAPDAAAATVLAATGGDNGGVHASQDGGATWGDGGLTNQAFRWVRSVSVFRESSQWKAFASVSEPSTGKRALFRTENYGPNATWARIDRHTDMTSISPVSGFPTPNIVYGRRSGKTSQQVLKSVAGGPFTPTATDPGVDPINTSREVNELDLFAGAENGVVWRTTDGGATWTAAATDLGGRVRSISFRTGAGVSIDPRKVTVLPGAPATVEVKATAPPTGLSAWALDVTYDPDVVSVSSCTPTAPSTCDPAFATGKVRITGSAATALNGTTTLASITFAGSASPSSTGLGLSGVTFTDSRGIPVDTANFTGFINVSTATSTPAPTPAAPRNPAGALIASANSPTGNIEVWASYDGGATFGKVGSSGGAWGVGGSFLSVSAQGPDSGTGKYHVFVRPQNATDNDIFRATQLDPANLGATVWTPIGSPEQVKGTGYASMNFSSTLTSFGGARVGDGLVMYLMGRDRFGGTTRAIWRTYFPFSVNASTWDQKFLPSVPVDGELFGDDTFIASFFSSSSLGRLITVLESPAPLFGEASRIFTWTDTVAFLTPPNVTGPADGATFSKNQDIQLHWNTVSLATHYQYEIAKDANFNARIGVFSSGGSSCPFSFALGGGFDSLAPSTESTTAVVNAFQLEEGVTYSWHVRVCGVNSGGFSELHVGPWSGTRTFSIVAGAAVTLNPASATAGTTVNFTLARFGASQLVEVQWDNPKLLLAAPTTDNNGNASGSFVVPEKAPVGLHIVRASSTGGSFSSAAAAFTVLSPTPPGDPTFRGAVTIGVPGPSAPLPPPGFHIDVTVFPPNGTTPVAAQTVHTDGQGVFAVFLPDLTAGNYDIKVKGLGALSRKKAGVALPQASAALPLSFGTLKTGDLNNDDVILGADYSILVTNFGASGPEVASAASILSAAEGPMPVTLSLSSMPEVVKVGEVLSVDVLVEAGEQPVDAVDAFLRFSSGLLQVVDETGAPGGGIQAGGLLPVVSHSEVDNAAGKIAFSAGRSFGERPATGSFILATIRFKVLAPMTGPFLPVVLEYSEPRMSGAYYRGQQLPGS